MKDKESGYDGFKMSVIKQDDISDRILPYVISATEAFYKLKSLMPQGSSNKDQLEWHKKIQSYVPE